jgi:hypothetical protein
VDFKDMRPKFVLALILVTALVLGAAVCLKQRLAPMPPEAPSRAAALPPSAAHPDLAAAANATRRFKPAPVAVPAAAVAADPMNAERIQAYIEEETSRLQEWSTQDDPASLAAILSDLTNSEKSVRLAAIEAAKQFGSRDAIAALKASVGNAADTGEQIALLEAADFLSLPTIADADVQLPKTPEQIQAAQQRRGQQAARRQAQTQFRAQYQNPQPAPVPDPQTVPDN